MASAFTLSVLRETRNALERQKTVPFTWIVNQANEISLSAGSALTLEQKCKDEKQTRSTLKEWWWDAFRISHDEYSTKAGAVSSLAQKDQRYAVWLLFAFGESFKKHDERKREVLEVLESAISQCHPPKRSAFED